MATKRDVRRAIAAFAGQWMLLSFASPATTQQQPTFTEAATPAFETLKGR